MKHIFTVTKDFIEHRNKIAKKYNDNGRDEFQKLMNCDCEFLEYNLVRDETSGHVSANRPQYDTIHTELGRCEFKCINKSNRVTIGDFTVLQEFDNFIFWKFISPHETILREGDVVECEISYVIPRVQGLKMCKPSNYGKGYYIQL
jgi:hypothetical protein